MSDTFVIIEESPPNVVIVEQTFGGVVITETASPASVIEVAPPPGTVIIEGEGPPNVVVIAPAAVAAGVSTFDGRPGVVTFELEDAELIFTASGQLLHGTGAGTGALLDIGSDGQVLTVIGGEPAWADSSGGVPFTEAGQIWIGTGAGTGTLLDPGTNGFVLTMSGGSPAWVAPSGGGGFTAGGDLSGSSSSQEVIGIQGVEFDNSPTVDGEIPMYSGGSLSWQSLGGDLNGAPDSAEVVGLLGIPFSGSPSSGDTLEYDGTDFIFVAPGAGSFPTFIGSGSPEGSQVASPGDSYEDTNTGAVYFFNGTPSTDTGWTAGIAQTVDYDGTSISLTGIGLNDPNMWIVGTQTIITDQYAFSAPSGTSRNALVWNGSSTDGDQTLFLQLGPIGGGFQWDWNADGSTSVPGPLTLGNEVTLFSYNGGNPNGTISANAKGDICYDQATPAVWQASASGTSSWVNITGGGGAYASLTGAGESSSPGDLTQAGGFTVNDTASDGISFTTGSTGEITLLGGPTSQNEIAVHDNLLFVGSSESNGSEILIRNEDSGAIIIQDYGGGISIVEEAGSDGAQVSIYNANTGGIVLNDAGGGGITLEVTAGGGINITDSGSGTDYVVLPNLPTSDPMLAGQLWADDFNVVLSGFTGGGGGSFPTFTGSGQPEGVVTATAVGQSYQDTTNGGIYFFTGSPPADTGWVSGQGNMDYSGTRVAGFGMINDFPTILTSADRAFYLSDVAAFYSGSSNGVTYSPGASDGDQTLSIKLGPSGSYDWLFNSDGTTSFPEAIFVNGSTGAAGIFVYDGDPNGVVSAVEQGDICLDGSVPTIWQASGAGTSSWVNIGGTGIPFTADGDLWVGTGAGTGDILSIGSAGQVLTVSGGTAAWEDAPGAGSFPDFTGSGSPAGSHSGTTGQWYEDTSEASSGLYVRTPDQIGTAYLYGDADPTFPVTVVTGTNDEFVYTPIATGTPETFTIAAGTYANQYELENAVAAAIGSTSSEAWSTHCETVFTGSRASVLAGSLPTVPLTVVTGVNDTFIYTPIATGIPETFTVAAGTYTTDGDLFNAMYFALGSMSGEGFGTKIAGYISGGKFFYEELAPGTYGNGDTLTTGPTDILASIGFTSPATFSGGTDGRILLQLNGGGGASNGDTITFGANDVAADLGLTGNPDTFENGYGSLYDGWMQVGGASPGGVPQFGLSTPQYGLGQIQLLAQDNAVIISDLSAIGHSGNGIYWQGAVEDGTQYIQFSLGPSGEYETFFSAAGQAQFPGPVQIDYNIGGGGAYLHSYAGDPNGHVSPNSAGDICIDVGTPAIWQSTSSSDTSWEQQGGSVPFTAAGQLWVGTGSGTATELSVGSDGQILTLVSGTPAWVNPGGGGGSFPDFAGSGTPEGSQSASFGQWYMDNSGSTSGIFVKGTDDAISAYVYGNSFPTIPLTVTTGVNDEFTYTPIATGTPETFTIAPGTYNSLVAILNAIDEATGSTSGEPFNTYVQAETTGYYTPAVAYATSAPTLPFAVAPGVNDTFVFTPITTGIPETFTVAPGTYTTESDLATAMMAATGSGSDVFSDFLDGYGVIGGTQWLEIYTGDNADGDTLTTGPTDILAGLGFASPTTFAEGIAGPILFVSNTSGSANNGDTITPGANDVSAALGLSNPTTFEHGYGGPLYGWMQVGGYASNPTFGLSGSDGQVKLLSEGNGVVISDTTAQVGSGNGVYWYTGSQDYEQELQFNISGVLESHGWYFGDYEGVSYSEFPGPISTPVLNQTGAYAMTGNEGVLIADGAVNLPSPNVAYENQIYIKDSGGGTTIIYPFGAETIDGGSSISLSALECALLTNDGTNWWRLS